MRAAAALAAIVAASSACAEIGEPPPGLEEIALTAGGGLRVMSYNIKHGGESSLENIAAVIAAEAPDLVALEEVDLLTNRSGRVDQAARLGELTGMEHAFVPALLSYDGGQYGLALLSRHPILTAERIALPSAGEQRALALFEVEVGGEQIVPVGVTHFGITGAAERQSQAAAVLAALAGRPSAILAGDLNATSSEASIATLRTSMSDAWSRGGSGSGNTIPALFPTRRIDYLFLGADWTPRLTARVPGASWQSDHRPVVATLIPPWSQTVFGDRVPARPVEGSDTRSVELGVAMRVARAGTVQAIRFYRGAGSPGGYRARLWDQAGALLADLAVPDGPVPGWQEVALQAPVALAAGATVTASYHAPGGRFARDTFGLSAPITSGDLTATRGVYRYGGGFPAASYKDTNYWVDLRFRPD
jgi:endonuclease/exonuclease/phosphatase family metal-dependent hydrolase